MSGQDRAVTAGLTAARRVAGQAIVYGRGDTEIEITAIKGRHPIQQITDETVYGSGELTDWIFPAADLGALGLPARGDYVEYAGARFDVVSQPGLDCYSYSDPGRTWLRVHTLRTE